MHQHIGIHEVGSEMRRQRGIEFLPEGHRRRCVLAVEISHVADRLALPQEIGTACQICVPSFGLLGPRDVTRVILSERAKRHSRSVCIVDERLQIAGVKNNAVDAAREILVGKRFQVERTLSPRHDIGPGRKRFSGGNRLAVNMCGRRRLLYIGEILRRILLVWPWRPELTHGYRDLALVQKTVASGGHADAHGFCVEADAEFREIFRGETVVILCQHVGLRSAKVP